MADDDAEHTYTTKFRIPKRMWEAYGLTVGDRERGPDLLDHVRTTIQEKGGERALELLAAAEEELAERRSRKGGRPPTSSPAPPA